MFDYKKIEKEVLEYWEKNKIYDKVKAKNINGKKFYFLQGPPYTSGKPHMGHAWNHALKDMTLRYKRMKGLNVWDRAGYDMHGLPTEHKVQALHNLKTKQDIINFGLERFSEECYNFSSMIAREWNKHLWNMGIWLDYENAYLPINNEYIEGIWWLIKKAHEKGRLYQGLKTISWCPHCATALAKHECLYKEVEEPSIYVKFPIKGRDKEFLVIWTTTPWTIAFNLAIMVNPDLDYVKVEAGDEKWIIAKGLAGALMQSVFNMPLKVVEEFKGKELEGIEYEHPWKNEIKQFVELKAKHPKVHTVVLSSEYVTLGAGSGLVHCAPGCGPEDYEVGHRNDIPPFNNINEDGSFPDNMGRFSNLIAKKDDKKFIEALKDDGLLLAEVPVSHDYAHCERCFTPVVFRATEQWFFKVEDLRDKMLESNSKILWVPESGKNAFNSWLTHLRDNSITKQRFWGTPVPIWICDDCKDYVVVESAKELEELGAKNVPKNLHKPWIDAVVIPCKCGGLKKRLPDILDVWIDAGSASWNCLYYPKEEKLFNEYFPADFILEAKEQVRGWFNLLMVASMIAFEKSCFKAVYMHGMLTDVDGVKMSKSLGNVISPQELIDKHGTDTMRLYLCNTPAGEDISFSWAEALQKYRHLSVLWNVHQYLIDYCKAENINPSKISLGKLDTEEAYIMSKLHRTIKLVTQHYEAYELDRTPKLIESLFLELSRDYIQLTRDKVSEKPELVLKTIYEVLLDCLKMLSTICPFITEKIYLNLKSEFSLETESIHLFDWPNFDESLVNEKLEQRLNIVQQVIQALLAAREKAKLSVRWPIKEATVVTQNKDVKEAVEVLSNLIKTLVNVKEVNVKSELTGAKIKITANKGAIGKSFKQNSKRILEALDEQLLNKIYTDGKVQVEGFTVSKEFLNITEELPENIFGSTFRQGSVYLNTESTPELESEGFFREVVRRVQMLRKESNLKKVDRIELSIESDIDLKSWGKDLKAKVGALTLYFEDRGFKTKEFTIKGHNFRIGINIL